MKFEVTRTSGYGDGPPCEGAVPAHFPSWDVRTLPTAEVFDERFPGDPWHRSGSEHRVIKVRGEPRIARRWPNRPGWALDLDSLDDLLAFCREHGEVVVSSERAELGETPKIEIYDDYRE